MEFDRHFGGAAAEPPVKFKSDWKISRLRVFTRSYGKTSVRLVNRGPGYMRLGTAEEYLWFGSKLEFL